MARRSEIVVQIDRAADCIAFNDAVGLYLVDNGDDFFDVHIQSVSGSEGLVQFIKQFGQLFSEELMRFAQAAAPIDRREFPILRLACLRSAGFCPLHHGRGSRPPKIPSAIGIRASKRRERRAPWSSLCGHAGLAVNAFEAFAGKFHRCIKAGFAVHVFTSGLRVMSFGNRAKSRSAAQSVVPWSRGLVVMQSLNSQPPHSCTPTR